MLERLAFTTVVVLLVVTPGSHASAQLIEPYDMSRTEVLLSNVALGIVASGVRAVVEDQPLLDAVVGGAVGGALSYGGKELSSTRLRILARPVASVGHSLIVTPGVLRTRRVPLWIPVGPLQLQLPAMGHSFRLRMDVTSAATTAYYLLWRSNDFRFDWSESLSVGVPVFTARTLEALPAAGAERFGVALLSLPVSRSGPSRRARILSHEVVHAIHYDFSNVTYGFSVESTVRGRAGESESARARFPLGIVAPLIEWAVPGDEIERFRETEAELIETGGGLLHSSVGRVSPVVLAAARATAPTCLRRV